MITTNLQQDKDTTDTMTWIQEPVVYDYFLRLNQGDFSGVSQLFAEDGYLSAHFHNRVCGRNAIYAYLQKEARGIKVVPQSGSIESLPDDYTRHQLVGQVHTNLFTVNISWTIELNATKEITSVTVTLLAELQELLGLRHSANPSFERT